MGLAQIKSLKKRCIRLKKINYLYKTNLRAVKQIKILEFKQNEVPLWTDAYAVTKRDKLIDFLKSKNIECRKFWYPLHIQRPFKGLIINLKIHRKFIRIYFGFHHH